MAGIDAPYTTANEIDAHVANPLLAGVTANFDPANPNPLGGLQKTFDRLDTEQAGSYEAQKQRVFQQQQQERQEKHDLLKQQMLFDQEKKMKDAEQAIKDRDALYDMMQKSGGTSAMIKDENGNDMSIPFLPADQTIADQAANEFQKGVIGNPANFKTPDMVTKYNNIKRLNQNASARAIYALKAQQYANQTYDTQEKARALEYIDGLKSGKLDPNTRPLPFTPQSTIQPMIDMKGKYKNTDNYESFDGDMQGVPNAEYVALQNTTDPLAIDEGFKRYGYFKNQPQGQDPIAYQEYQNHVNEIAAARGLPKIDLGGKIGPDGKLIFDDNTYAKQQQLAKNHLAATELMNNGTLQDDPDAEKDQADLDYKKAQTAKERADISQKWAEIAEKKREWDNPHATGKGSEKEKVDKDAALSVYHQVQGVMDVSKAIPQNYVRPEKWKEGGIDPDQYKIYKIPDKNADKFIGIQAADVSQKTTSDGVVTTKASKGNSVVPDAAYIIVDKKTGEKKLAYLEKGKVAAVVPEKEAISNGLKHDAKWQPKEYEGKIAVVDQVYGGGAPAQQQQAQQPSSANQEDESIIAKRLVPIKIKMKNGKIIPARMDPVTKKRYAAE